MLPIRQSHKVLRSVVMLNSVKVMNHPSVGESLIMRLFPYKNMLLNIAILASTMMSWLPDKNITTLTKSSATFPLWMFFRGTVFYGFIKTLFAHMREWIHLPTTSRAYPRVAFAMSHTVFSLILSCLLAPIIFCDRFLFTPLSTIRAIWSLVATCLKGYPTIFTFLVNHLPYQFNTNQAKSQVGGYYG